MLRELKQLFFFLPAKYRRWGRPLCHRVVVCIYIFHEFGLQTFAKKEGWEWGQGKWSSWKYESDNSFEVATMMMMAHQTGGSPTLAWLLRRRWTRLRIFEQTSSFSESLKVKSDDWGIAEHIIAKGTMALAAFTKTKVYRKMTGNISSIFTITLKVTKPFPKRGVKCKFGTRVAHDWT